MNFRSWLRSLFRPAPVPTPVPPAPPPPVGWTWSDPGNGSGWTGKQVQNAGSDAYYVNGVMECDAGPRTSAGKVGKACFIKAFPVPAVRGDTVKSAFMLQLSNEDDGLTIWDLECKECGVSTQPGLRLNIDEGLLRFERSKLGGYSPEYQSDSVPLLPGVTYHIELEVTLGGARDGRMVLRRDGKTVIDATGVTMPLKSSPPGSVLTAEQVDRVQVGLTSNFGPRPAEISIKDFSVSI